MSVKYVRRVNPCGAVQYSAISTVTLKHHHELNRSARLLSDQIVLWFQPHDKFQNQIVCDLSQIKVTLIYAIHQNLSLITLEHLDEYNVAFNALDLVIGKQNNGKEPSSNRSFS